MAFVALGEPTSRLAFSSLGSLVSACGVDGVCRRLRYEILSGAFSVVLGRLPKCSASKGANVSVVASESAMVRWLKVRRNCTVLRFCGLTFELSWHRRCDARARVAKMYRVPPAGPAWPAVGARLERGVRQRAAAVAVQAKSSRSNFGALTRQPRWRPAVMASCGDGWPALTRAGTGAWETFWPDSVAGEGAGTKRPGNRSTRRRVSKDEATWPSRLAACHHSHLALPNVRAKLAPTAWRAGQQAQNGPQARRLMAGVPRCWSSA